MFAFCSFLVRKLISINLHMEWRLNFLINVATFAYAFLLHFLMYFTVWLPSVSASARELSLEPVFLSTDVLLWPVFLTLWHFGLEPNVGSANQNRHI